MLWWIVLIFCFFLFIGMLVDIYNINNNRDVDIHSIALILNSVLLTLGIVALIYG